MNKTNEIEDVSVKTEPSGADVAVGVPVEQPQVAENTLTSVRIQNQAEYVRNQIVPLKRAEMAMIDLEANVRGRGLCYKPTCNNKGVKSCSIQFCCSELGCGKLVCDKHSSKRKCWPGANSWGVRQKVCKECEPEIKRKTCRNCVLIFFIIFLTQCFQLIRLKY